jgi:hypothetical protein
MNKPARDSHLRNSTFVARGKKEMVIYDDFGFRILDFGFETGDLGFWILD